MAASAAISLWGTLILFWQTLALASLPLVWLIPQHYLPWLAAHQDVVSLSLLALAGIVSSQRQAVPVSWLIAAAGVLASVGLQTAFGPIAFGGDAWMATLYVVAFAGAIGLGQSLGALGSDHAPTLDALALGMVGAAVLSVAIASMQWTRVEPLPLPVYGLLPGDRPYANFAQANNFCTAVFLGLCSLCWLGESGRIGGTGWILGSAYLLFGMTMSGSRTGWLQVALLVMLVATIGRRAPQRVLRLPHALSLLALLTVFTLAWPALNQVALLAGTRDFAEQAELGLRWPLWQVALDAIAQHPLWGYGWQQIPSAQWEVALEHPPMQRYFEHAHNVVLDLMLWAGIPIGGLIAVALGFGLWRQVRATDDARALWLFAGVLGFFIHALLEQPHAYAYLLMPVGVAIGVVHALCPGQRELSLPAAGSRVAWAAVAAAITLTAVDYLEVEQNYRAARAESTFGSRRIITPAPELQVLSQLEAFMRFIRTEARPGMTSDELATMRRVVQRYGHPPALLRLALAEGLNGQPEAARDTLRRLCAMHLAQRCVEARASWSALQQQYPVLASIPAPTVPPAR